MDNDPAKNAAENGDDSNQSKKNKGPKRSKTEHLKIDSTIDIQPDNMPEGSIFKGRHPDLYPSEFLFDANKTS
jgi:hypothetical protein